MYSRKPHFQSRQEMPLTAGTVPSIHDEQRREALLLISADTRDKCINLVRLVERNLVKSASNRIPTVRWSCAKRDYIHGHIRAHTFLCARVSQYTFIRLYAKQFRFRHTCFNALFQLTTFPRSNLVSSVWNYYDFTLTLICFCKSRHYTNASIHFLLFIKFL